MIRFSALALCSAFALVGSSTARAADEPKDILAKAIKAHGGEEPLTKFKAAQSKAKGKITLPGVGEAEFTQDLSYMIPDKFRDSMELKVAGQTISILTLVSGDKISIEVNGKAMDVPEQAKASLKDASHMLQVARLVTLKDKKYELSLIGEDKVEGKKVVGIRVSAKDQKDISLYFDTQTWLLAKLAYRGSDPATGNEINEERIVKEYGKSKNGMPQPKKVVVKHDGKLFLEAEIVESTMLEKIDESEFKK